MATEVGVGYVRLLPSMAGFSAAASRQMTGAIARPAAETGRRAGESLSSGISGGMERSGRAISGFGDRMTRGVTLPVLGVGAAALSMSGNFEAGMNRVGAISGATGSELDAMREQAREMGATTQFSATEAADAMGFLSMAGFDATQTMDALPGVLNLAAAGGLDLATSADIASNVLSGFGLEVSELGRLNDVMAATMTSANTDLMQLGGAFTYVGPVASSAGLSIEETSAAIGLLSNAGIQGEQAGTALRGSIARLIDPPGEAADALDRLGVSVTNSSGDLLPLVDIVGQLEDAGASTADMMQIFGVEAGPGMQAMVSQGSDALRDLTSQLEDSGGTAEDIAATQMEGLNGSMAELKSAFEGLMIAVGESGLLEWATSAVEALAGFTQGLGETNPELLKLISTIAIGLAVAGPFLSITGRMVTTAAQLGRGTAMAARGTARLATGLGRAGAAGARGLGRLASGFRNAQAAESAFSGRMGTIGGKLRQATNALGRLAAAAVRTGARVAAAFLRMAAQAAAATARMVAQVAIQIARYIALGIAALASAAQVAIAWLISIGPILLIGAAIAGLVALVVIHFDTIKNAVGAAFDWIVDKISGVISWIGDNWQMVLAIITGPIGAAVWIITSHWDTIVGVIQGAIDWVRSNWPVILAIITGPIGLAVLTIVRHWDTIKDAFNNVKIFIRNKISEIVGFFRGMPGRIRRAASGAFDGLKDAFRAALNAIIRWWNNISFTLPTIEIPGFDPPGPGPSFPGVTIGGQTFNTPNIPTLHDGGIFQAPGGAREGLALLESGERVLPASASGGGAVAPAAVRVEIDVTGGPAEMVKMVQKWVRTSGGGDVQSLAGVR